MCGFTLRRPALPSPIQARIRLEERQSVTLLHLPREETTDIRDICDMGYNCMLLGVSPARRNPKVAQPAEQPGENKYKYIQ
jgi:hypothetical protein